MKRILLVIVALAALSAPVRAANSSPALSPQEQAKYNKLKNNEDRRKFMATREFIKKNMGKNVSSTNPKPMPMEVELQFALDEGEKKFLLEIAMDEAI